MAGQIFTFITHKTGKADDSALELVTAAGKIYPDASTTAIVTGAGPILMRFAAKWPNPIKKYGNLIMKR